MSSPHKRTIKTTQNSRSTSEYIVTTRSTTAIKNEEKDVCSKRAKSGNSSTEDLQILKRKNFVKACELVSQEAYFNYAERLQLIYMPICMDRNSCVHFVTPKIKEMPYYVRHLIEVELKASKWCEALEVCILSITPTQYLSDVVLKDIVEIALNAHEDLSSGYTVSQVIDKCKFVLSLHFNTHCPCLDGNLRNMYIQFLTSPMDRKENTVSNRTDYGSNDGIVYFCLKRLEYELRDDSVDEALLDKYSATPENLKQSIKGLFWQKEKFDVFEMLDRNDRIDRLMSVLHSIIELLQFDLAIWQSNNNAGLIKQLRRQKNLMASIMWKNKFGTVDNICKLVLKLFCYVVHLEYPEEHIKTMTIWVNTVIEMFYITGNRSHIDYPTIGSYCELLIKEFDNIISHLPQKSIIKILERIKPAYIRHEIGHRHCMTFLSTGEHDTLRMLIDFLKKPTCKSGFVKSDNDLIEYKKFNTKKVKPNKLLKNLSIICNNAHITNSTDNNNISIYPKFCPDADEIHIDESHVTQVLYITLHAYLDAYRIQILQETVQKLNDQLTRDGRVEKAKITDSSIFEQRAYVVTESFIKTYRVTYEMLKELIKTINQLKKNRKLSKNIMIFTKLINNILEL